MADKEKITLGNGAMTIQQLLDQGRAIILGEWRGSVPETINYISKKGQPAKFGRVSHTVEIGDGKTLSSVTVSQSVPDSVAAESVVVPFAKGQRAAVEVDSMHIEKGQRSIGTTGIHALPKG